MPQIIITVKDDEKNVLYDLEVPNDLEVEKLLDDIIQTLTGANPALTWNLEQVSLLSPKHNRTLQPDKTLKEECIWNGDYLHLIENQPQV